MAKNFKLLSFGEALIDFTPTADNAYKANVGGAPLNLAVCTAKYGCKTAFVGKLGKDAFGKMIADTAKNKGVDMSGVLWDNGRVTTHAFVTLDSATGERDFLFCRNHGADVNITKEELPACMIGDTECFHFGGLSLTNEGIKAACIVALDCAVKAGAWISFDPNYRASLWESEEKFVKECRSVLPRVDILKVSGEEALMLTGTENEEKALKALAETISVVLLTKGEQGAVCALGGKRIKLPPHPAKAVDTTGAGDIFFGSFLGAMLTEGYTPYTLTQTAAQRFGTASCMYAAKSTEKYGAIPSIPKFLQEK